MNKLFVTFELAPVSGELTAQEEQALAKPIFDPIFGRLVDAGLVVLAEEEEEETEGEQDAADREPDEVDEDDEGTGPFRWDEYGWYCECKINGATVTVMLQRSDEWMIQIWADRGLFDRLRGRHYADEIRSVADTVTRLVREEFGVQPTGPMTELELRAS